ncbi:cytochrome c oxidase subunit I [Vulgatibacter incomptus]|uniref:Cytochrome c oxidase subunit 1 n=1 Tax=Vulgatibacter incomptus TaxID=1391653 RepID=A0A0K1PHD3_9BACT|nr:cytochrome c oxidase subunit I [Vulgatibacter incomptus]AKU92806.1 Cytochrome c oxidase polypeptide I [Vulgatibacter incomptus]
MSIANVPTSESPESLPKVHYWNATKGWKSWAFTVDHKRIGMMYLMAILTTFFIGGIFAILVRLQLLNPGGMLVGNKVYNQIFTLHGVVMVFLFLVPSIPASLGNFFLPMQLGAKDVAFPKLNLASLYIYVIGAAFALYSMVAGAVDTGWTFYTPYSITTNTAVVSMTFAAFILGFSSILTGLNFIVTTHKLRAPGMTWMRMPLLIWALYATSVIQLLATPVLAITLLLTAMERVLGVGIFDPALGGDPILYQHFFWFYSHPAVYIMAVPGFGVVSEIIATFTRRPVFGYRFVALSSLAIAFIGFFVWGHHMFVSGQSEFAGMVFSFLSFFVAIPTAVKIFNWTATLYKGSIKLESPLLFILAFLIQFTIGGLTGLPLATLATDVHLHDTYYVVAHFHYVMMGGTVFAFIGGLHYWWPKMTGRMYNEPLAKLAACILFVGFNITFFTQFVLGLRGMPRRYATYLEQFQNLHAFSSVGSWILAVGFLLIAAYLLQSLRSGRIAPANPWGASTLEWQTQSPPITENFVDTPHVTTGPYVYPDQEPVPSRRVA